MTRYKWVTEWHLRKCSVCGYFPRAEQTGGYCFVVFINPLWVSGADPTGASLEIAFCQDCLDNSSVGPYVGDKA